MKKLFLLSFIILATAIQENGLQYIVNDHCRQGDLLMVEMPKSLQETSLGRAILSLASIQSQSQQVDYGRLFDALDELEAYIQVSFNTEQNQESRDAEALSFQSDYNRYTSDIAFYQNQVTQFQNEVAQHEVDLADLNDKDTSLVQRLENKRKELEQYNGLKASLARSIEDSQQSFTHQNDDLGNAIYALDQAIALVEDLRKGSFIEKERFEGTKNELQDKLQKQEGSRLLYQPLISALVQMSQSNFSNQRQVQQVLALLRDLRNQMNASRLSLVNAFQAEKERNNALAEEYDELISSLVDTSIPQVQTAIENNQSEIQAKNNLANDATDNLRLASENFDATETAWVKRQADNKGLKEQYDGELVVISQARTALERGGIKRQ